MTFRSLFITLSLITTAGSIPAAQAADVTINVSGNIVVTPCEVMGGSTTNVDLGSYSETVSNSENYAYEIKYFTINLINCPTAYDVVNMKLQGQWDNTHQVLVNTGTAKNTGIKVYIMKSGYQWGLAQDCAADNACSWSIDKEQGVVAIQFAAHIENLADQITEGTVSGQIVFELTYQ